MINRINLTKDSSKKTAYLLNTLGLRPNVTSRNALLYSIGKGHKFDQNEEIKCDGKELNVQVLFGDNSHIYFMLLKQYYGKKISKLNVKHLISYHIDQAMQDEEFVNLLKGKI